MSATTHRRTAAAALVTALTLALITAGAGPVDGRQVSNERETRVQVTTRPGTAQSSPVFVASPTQVLFEALEPASTVIVGTPACESPILSGHVLNIWRQGSQIYATLATEHPEPATVAIHLWDGAGFDATFSDDVLRKSTQTAVYSLTPGTTYYAEAIATDAKGKDCPPRYGSFTVPAGL